MELKESQALEPARELSYGNWLRETDAWLESSCFSDWLLAEDGSRRLQPLGTNIVLILQGCVSFYTFPSSAAVTSLQALSSMARLQCR